MILEPPVFLGRFQARVMEDPLQFSRLMPYGAEGVADHVRQRKKLFSEMDKSSDNHIHYE